MRRAEVNVDLLAETELFAELSPGDRTSLGVCLRAIRYDAGEIVLREGEPGATMLIVAEGALLATARTPFGKQSQLLNRMSVGEVFGEMAVLDPAPRSATVIAVTSAVAYELASDALETLRRHAPSVLAAIERAAIREVSRRLSRLEECIGTELSRLAEACP
jgi:CRP/FNR family cyclic AMP-dependent transcriptional regulator